MLAAAVGIAGLYRRDFLPYFDLGFAFLTAEQGKGYAFEACKAVMAAAKTTHGVDRLLALVQATNLRSVRLLTRLGFAFSHFHRYASGEEVSIYRIDM